MSGIRCGVWWVEPVAGDRVRCIRPTRHTGPHQYLAGMVTKEDAARDQQLEVNYQVAGAVAAERSRCAGVVRCWLEAWEHEQPATDHAQFTCTAILAAIEDPT